MTTLLGFFIPLLCRTQVTNKVAIKIAFDKNLENDEKHFNIERFYKIVLSSLTRCEESGLIERIGREGRAILWQVKRD